MIIELFSGIIYPGRGLILLYKEDKAVIKLAAYFYYLQKLWNFR